jgi:hypothetical protein
MVIYYPKHNYTKVLEKLDAKLHQFLTPTEIGGYFVISFH